MSAATDTAPPTARDSSAGLPLGLPCPNGTLVLLRHRRRARYRPALAPAAGGERRTAIAGLRLWGMADDAPRPWAGGSNASPTSSCIMSDTSKATLPPRRRTARGRRKSGRRGCGPSARAAPAPRGQALPRAPRRQAAPAHRMRASVPAAPPAAPRACAYGRAADRSRASTAATSHPAAFLPNVVGRACWRSVRATIGVDLWRPASSAVRRPGARGRRATRSRTLRRTSMRAVSMTSWLVAPKWAQPAMSGGSP